MNGFPRFNSVWKFNLCFEATATYLLQMPMNQKVDSESVSRFELHDDHSIFIKFDV